MFHLKVLENSPLLQGYLRVERLVQVLRKFDHSIFNGFAQRGVDMNDVYFYLRSTNFKNTKDSLAEFGVTKGRFET